MFGLLIGSLLAGPLGDKFGRRRSSVSALCVFAPCLIAESFMETYTGFMALRFVSWVCTSVVWVNGVAMILEVFGEPSLRKQAYIILTVSYCVDVFLKIGLGAATRHWAKMHLTAGIFAAVIALLLMLWLEESPRWLVISGRSDRAEKVFAKAAKMNKVELKDEKRNEMAVAMEAIAKNEKEEKKRQKEGRLNLAVPILEVFKPSLLKRTLLLLGIWSSAVTSFYVLALNVTELVKIS